MNGPLPAWTAQAGFGVRFGWGPAGIEALSGEVSALVLVDVLRFTTALDVATSRGAVVEPAPWPFAGGGAEGTVADGSGPRALSLSPGSLGALAPGERVVLPSANGSHCSTLAAATSRVVVGACLRNAAAVGAWLSDHASVAVIACGERWPDGSLRPAVEDLLGAGAVVATLAEARSCSPEAAAAGAAYGAAGDSWDGRLHATESGRELAAKGLADDIGWAAAFGVSETVPVLGVDGAYRAA